MMMKKIYRRSLQVASVFLLLALSLSVYGQKQVSGAVTDADGGAMPGVNVVVKGTTIGTTTNADGRYSVEAAEDATLVFSFIGYTTQEIRVGAQTTINIRLIEDIETLDEIVVVGYGEQKRSDLTGAIASVKGDAITKTQTSGVDQALIGRVAGVSAVQMSGQPGASVSIRIRGTSSVNSGTEPLYVIDGVPYSGNNGSVYDYGLGAVGGGGKTTFSPLSALNPNDIESIEVLKDASAAAIYGNRASNGVVIIQTKRGKKGNAKLTYDGYYGIQSMPKFLDMMNLREYAQFRNDFAAETAGETPDPRFADPSLLGEGTDWQDAIFDSAPIQNHQLGLSGGSDAVRYSLSTNYFNQDGVAIGSNFSRYSMRLNLDADINKWLKVGNSLSISRTGERLGRFDRGGIISTALTARPDVPVRNFDGSYSGGEGEGSFVSPIAQALDLKNLLTRVQTIGNLFADIKLRKDLTFRTEFGGNYDMALVSSWKPTYNYGGGAVNNQSSIAKQNNINYFWQFKNYVTYTKSFGDKHNMTAMIGQEASEWGYNNLSGGSLGLPTNTVSSINLGEVEDRTAGDAFGAGALSSFYGRLNYNFLERYFLTYTIRRDGSGKFAEGQKWGNFHSFAAKWKISDESFMQGIENVVNDLNIRASWGQTGNSSIDAYLYGSRLETLPTNLGLGFRVSNHANPLLSWETSEAVDIGLDAAFLQGRIKLNVDVYRRHVKDLLNPYPLPAYMGSLGNGAIRLKAPWTNTGEIENRGLEIVIDTDNLSGDLEWNTNFNISFNRNKLIDLGIKDATLDGFVGGSGNILLSRTMNGMPLGQFYGYKVVGIFKDKEDILNSPVQWDTDEVDGDGNPIFSRTGTVWPGDLKFADLDGNDTIDVRDRTFIGNPQPKFTFGFNNTFRYKGFDLDIFLMGSYGNKIYNYNKQGEYAGIADMRSFFANQLKEVTGRAKLEPITPTTGEWWNDIDNVRVMNPAMDIPRAITTDPNQNTRVSDRYIEDGSFIRIRNISLGYTLPNSLTGRAGINHVRIYGSVQNAFTFTKYSGYDPEVGQDTNDPNISGLDFGRYPSPRIVSFGVSASF